MAALGVGFLSLHFVKVHVFTLFYLFYECYADGWKAETVLRGGRRPRSVCALGCCEVCVSNKIVHTRATVGY